MGLDWTKVVTHPLGLVGFALALAFAAAGLRLNRRRSKSRTGSPNAWPLAVGLGLAALVLTGGLYLAHEQTQAHAVCEPPPPQPAVETRTKVDQTTHGPGSPAIHDVGGSVSISVSIGQQDRSAQRSPVPAGAGAAGGAPAASIPAQTSSVHQKTDGASSTAHQDAGRDATIDQGPRTQSTR